MIRAVFFDVDCTLYSHELNQIPDSAVEAIQKLKEKDILVFLATGRHKKEIEQLNLNGLKFDGFVTLSGQLCLDQDFNVIYENPIFTEDVIRLREKFNEKKVPMIFVEEDDMYMNFYTEGAKRAQQSINLVLPKIKNPSNKKLYQVTMFDDKKVVYDIASELQHSKCTGWNIYGTDIIPEIGGKAMGIQAMMKHYHVSQEELLAFGDSENDIDMLEFVKIGIAMENGNEELKAIADFVTESVDEDGIYNALVRLNII